MSEGSRTECNASASPNSCMNAGCWMAYRTSLASESFLGWLDLILRPQKRGSARTGGRDENGLNALDAGMEMKYRLSCIRRIDGLTLQLIKECFDW